MPDTGCNNELHIVVSLVCGMGPDPHSNDESQENGDSGNNGDLTPMTRLKEALSSPESFKKHFLVSS